MPYVFECEACHFKMSISDEMFTRRFEGKRVTVKCKACKADIHVDGAALAAKPRASIPRPDPRPAVSAPPVERVSTGARPLPPRGELRKTLLGMSPEELVPRRPAPPRRTRASLASVDPLGATALDAVPAQVNGANVAPAGVASTPEPRASVPRTDGAGGDASPAPAASGGLPGSAPRDPPNEGAREPATSPAQARPAPPRRTRSSSKQRKTVLGVAPPHGQSATEAHSSVPRADGAIKDVPPAPAASEGTLESAPRDPADGTHERVASPGQARPAPPRRTRSSSKLNALRTTVLGVGPAQIQSPPQACASVTHATPASQDEAAATAPATIEGSLESAPRGQPDGAPEFETSPAQALETTAAETPQDVDPNLPAADAMVPEPEPACIPDAAPSDVEAEAGFFDREPITPPISWAPGPPIAERKRPRRGRVWAAVLVGVVGIGSGVLAAARWVPAHGSGKAPTEARASAGTAHPAVSVPPRQETKQPPAEAAAAQSLAPEPAPSQAQPAAPAAAPARPLPSVASASDMSSVPAAVRRNVLQHRVYLAMKKAEDCHRGGRARGKAQVFITFGPDGHVSRAWLEGEPVASAPVGRCVLELAEAVKVPPYQGEPFTYRARVTLR
ncbi:MAG: hypothetical protein JW940_19835 [Polyangiaceae bacterium]|nr:hypothetical protein [Polyangiaceae bacterium]